MNGQTDTYGLAATSQLAEETVMGGRRLRYSILGGRKEQPGAKSVLDGNAGLARGVNPEGDEMMEIRLMGGQMGGLVKVEELVKKLNAVEKDLNSLKQVFQGWVTVPQDGGAALKTAATTWATQQLTETQKSDIENEKVKQ